MASTLYFECKKGHIFTQTFTLEDITRGLHKLPCRCHMKYNNRRCNNKAERVYISEFRAKVAMSFRPTLYFESPTGEIAMPDTNNIHEIPKEILDSWYKQGYKEKSIQTFSEYEAMLRRYQQRVNDVADIREEIRNQEWDAVRKEAVETVTKGFTYPIYDKDGKVVGEGKVPRLEDMHPTLRKITEKCLEYINRPLEGENRPQHYIDAFENANYNYKDHDEHSRWI